MTGTIGIGDTIADMDSLASVSATLAGLALSAFALFLQLIIYILSFFLVLARVILTALHIL